MAIIPKTNKSFTDQFGNEYSDGYLVVDKFTHEESLLKEKDFVYDIYMTSAHRDAVRDRINGDINETDDPTEWALSLIPCIQRGKTVVPNDDYDTYFGIAKQNTSGNNNKKLAYDYMLTLPEWSDFESDE